MANNNPDVTVRQTGISLASILGIVFIVLKLTKHIDWDWLWVLAPFWIPLAFAFCVFLLAALLMVAFHFFGAMGKKGK